MQNSIPGRFCVKETYDYKHEKKKKNDYRHDKVRTFSMRNHDHWYIMQVLTTFFYKVRKFSMSNHDRWYIMHFLMFFLKMPTSVYKSHKL